MPERSAWTLNPKITAEQTEACITSQKSSNLQLSVMTTQIHPPPPLSPNKNSQPNFSLLVYLFNQPLSLLENE